MTARIWRIFLLMASALLAPVLGGVAPARAGERPPDIRILIDISGSMKQNDPHNLRVPALRLLTGLLPKDARASVWTYGQYVNMLVPPGTVDERWRARASAGAGQINSLGLYTNIPDVLTKSTADWTGPDAHYERHVIMLTDGLVDISKDPQENAGARRHIIEDILPRLKQQGVRIHTVALSSGADHALLKRLAETTGGYYEQADSAERLERLFLRLFEQATRPDTLPLKDNRVQVDTTIEELTLLVFRKDGAAPTRIRLPDGQEFSKEHPPGSVRWHTEGHYDLITVDHPLPGGWQVLADTDPDNRVLVVTNLRLRTTQLPLSLAVDDPVHMIVQLTQQGQIITQRDFLGLVQMRLDDQSSRGAPVHITVTDDGKGADANAGDGSFSARIAQLTEGRHDLVLFVDGKTFQREQRQAVQVFKEVVEASVDRVEGAPGDYVLALHPRADLVDPASVRAVARIDGGAVVAVPPSGNDGWQLPLDGKSPHSVSVSVQGRRPSGKPFSADFGPWRYGGGAVPVMVSRPPAAVATKPKTKTPARAHAKTPAATHWGWVAGEVLAVNLLVAGPLFYFFRRRAKRGLQNPAEGLTV